MYEIRYAEKTVVFGQVTRVERSMTRPQPLRVGTVTDDGKEVLSVRKVVTLGGRRPAKKYSKKDLSFLRNGFEGAWGRSKWRGVCEAKVDELFEHLDFDMLLESMGSSHPSALARWTDFKSNIKQATMNNQIIREKVKALEEVPVIKNYFLHYRV